MTMLRYAVLAGLCMPCWMAYAQEQAPVPVPVEPPPQERNGVWAGSLSASFSYARNAATATNWSLGADATRITDKDKWSLRATGLYGEKEDEFGRSRTADRLAGTARYDRNFDQQETFGFGLLELERDRMENLDLRRTVGVGLGYHWIRTDSTTFDVLAGIANTRSRHRGFPPDTVTEFLLGEESSHKLTENTQFKQKLTLYPSNRNGGEYRWTFDSSFVTALSDRIGLQIGVQHRYNTDVPVGTNRSDLLVLTGVNLKFGPK